MTGLLVLPPGSDVLHLPVGFGNVLLTSFTVDGHEDCRKKNSWVAKETQGMHFRVNLSIKGASSNYLKCGCVRCFSIVGVLRTRGPSRPLEKPNIPVF